MNIIHGKQEQLVVWFFFGLSETLFMVKKNKACVTSDCFDTSEHKNRIASENNFEELRYHLKENE